MHYLMGAWSSREPVFVVENGLLLMEPKIPVALPLIQDLFLKHFPQISMMQSLCHLLNCGVLTEGSWIHLQKVKKSNQIWGELYSQKQIGPLILFSLRFSKKTFTSPLNHIFSEQWAAPPSSATPVNNGRCCFPLCSECVTYPKIMSLLKLSECLSPCRFLFSSKAILEIQKRINISWMSLMAITIFIGSYHLPEMRKGFL